MTLKLTPAMLEASYELLRQTPPFRGWRLPHADEVVFEVSRHLNLRGQYRWMGDHHKIWISSRNITTTDNLVRAMAHEMCHLKERMMGVYAGEHPSSWQALADRVCRHHRFDRGLF